MSGASAMPSVDPGPNGKLRHRCRNPRCRMKLREPTDNLRSAFCCRLPRHLLPQALLGLRRSVRAGSRRPAHLRAAQMQGRISASQGAPLGKMAPPVPGETLSAPQNPIKPGIKTRAEGRRGWRNSSSPIHAPACVLDIEVFDRRWEAATSSDGIEIEVARLRNRALVSP